MRFAEGQTIVHPHHGPATVRAIKTRPLRNAECSYVLLEVHNTNLTVGVPVDSADAVGLRPVLDTHGLEKLFDELRGPSQAEESQWSRRFKVNQERLRTGDIYVTAGLVRDLSRRLEAKGTMSHAEKEMLRYAKRLLVTEICLAMGIGDDEAEKVLDDVLAVQLAGA
ncbi:CarD family transcriptional regulator [Arthrobacter sp. Marseille-P9274]|uniref:CarD family transcriptional regulator n=1 Tax=Arthrobacter sp. Marseille-P9274 TaxID=2866572 RepID=UPI0021C8E152|nr:CarD family transcriptional regulator [Arthrobacter sp. Marseille-P9274]